MIAPFEFRNPIGQKDEHGNAVFSDYWQRSLELLRTQAQYTLELAMAIWPLTQKLHGSVPEGCFPPSLASVMQGLQQQVSAIPQTPRVVPQPAEGSYPFPKPIPFAGVKIDGFIYTTASGFTANAYPARAFDSYVLLETDTFIVRYSNGTAWTQIILPAFIPFLGLTSSFPAWKRSAAIIQARLADDSAYTDVEVLDEAYGAPWDGSVEVPTKNALYDFLNAAFPTVPVSGTYTPTLTNVANLDASTSAVCQYVRVGNVVTVTGSVQADPTAPAASTQLGISLPIASNFANTNECGGAAACPTIAGQSAAIVGDVANNRAQMEWIAGDITNQPMSFTFSYLVI